MGRVLPLVLFLLSASLGAAQVHPDAVRHKEAGNDFLKLRQYENARDQYLAALQLVPAYSDAHYNLGVIYFFRLNDYPRALYHFVEYARLSPDAEDLSQVRHLAVQALQKVEQSDREGYAAALRAGTVEALERYLAEYPGTVYAQAVQQQLRSLGRR